MLQSDLSQKGVLTLTLDAPPANTLSEAMLAGLTDAVGNAAKEVRVIVIKATGKVFCAGHDLKEMTSHREDKDQGRAYYVDMMGRCATFMQAVVKSSKPVIAQVSGVATAAGCQLVASCDLAFASSKATFCTPGVNIGLFCSTPMVALSRNLSPKHAMEMLLTGDQMSAARALEFGLVNRVVEPEDLESITIEMAELIASKSQPVVATGKRAFYQQAEMGLGDAYDHCARVMVENMLVRDAQEGIGAILEKRKPVWKDC